MARIIGVISGKGGVGKTVVATNLAASLSKLYKQRVLLVDCNITTSHVGLYLGLYDTPHTLNDVLREKIPIERAIYTHQSGIDIIPASLKLDDLERVEWERVRRKFDHVIKRYDYIILDSSPGFNKESLITLGACEEVIIVTNPIAHTIADVVRAKRAAKLLNVKIAGVVLNMVRRKLYELSPKEVREITGLDVICSVPYDDKIAHSTVSKKPAVSMRLRNNERFYDLARYISGEEIQEEDFIQKLKSTLEWLQEIFSKYRYLGRAHRDEEIMEFVEPYRFIEEKEKLSPIEEHVESDSVPEETYDDLVLKPNDNIYEHSTMPVISQLPVDTTVVEKPEEVKQKESQSTRKKEKRTISIYDLHFIRSPDILKELEIKRKGKTSRRKKVKAR